MPVPRVHHRALQRAAELVGGADALAKQIGVPRPMLELWLAEREATPPDVFLRVVDIIVDYDLEAIKRNSGRGD